VHWLVKLTKLSLIAGLVSGPPFNCAFYHNLQQCGITEVTERFLLVSSISVNLAAEIAFILHADIFETEYVNRAGMNHVFYTRYKYGGNDALVAINTNLFSPFIITKSMESFPFLKDDLEKLLNDARQYQTPK
jgi:hypothetical protein